MRSRRDGDVVVELCRLFVRPAGGIDDHRRQPVGVVGIDKVEHRVAHRRRMVLQAVGKLLRRLPCSERGVDEIALRGKREAVVVHRGVEGSLVEEPAGFVPFLGHGVGLWVDRLHERVPVAPEGHGHLAGHVEPPAVDAVFRVAVAVGIHPPAGDVEHVGLRAGVEVFLRGVVGELGQRVHAPPALVLELVRRRGGVVVLLDRVPLLIGRGLLLLAKIPEGEEVAAGVVEYAVEHHPHAPGVGLLEELEEQPVGAGPLPRRGIARLPLHRREVAGGIGAEVRIDVMKGTAVVLVERAGVEHGVEIDRRHAEVLKVVESVDDALDVAAVAAVEDSVLEEVRADLLFPESAGIPVAGPRRHLPRDRNLILERLPRGVIGAVAIRESLGEKLIKHRVRDPVGHVGGGFSAGCLAESRTKRGANRKNQPPAILHGSAPVWHVTGVRQTPPGNARLPCPRNLF